MIFPRSYSQSGAPSSTRTYSIHSASLSESFPAKNRTRLALKPDQAKVLGTLTLKAPIEEDRWDRLNNLQKKGKEEGEGRSGPLPLPWSKGVSTPQLLPDAEVPSPAFTPGAHKSAYKLHRMGHFTPPPHLLPHRATPVAYGSSQTGG